VKKYQLSFYFNQKLQRLVKKKEGGGNSETEKNGTDSSLAIRHSGKT